MTKRLMIYGANGYTGRLIAKEAAARGLSPLLAGRNRTQIEALGRELGCETRVFELIGDVAAQLAGAGVGLVLHCAGPFVQTSEPMLTACLAARAHYLDITGEYYVFERVYRMHEQLKAAGILAVPGVAFDVVPTEGLAVLVKQRLPDATRVRVVTRLDRVAVTRGTMTSMMEVVASGVMVRENGELRPASVPRVLETVEFREGSFKLLPATAGELVAIHHSTGVPNIQIYMAGTDAQTRPIVQQLKLAPMLGIKPVRRILQRPVRATGKDPSDADLHENPMYVRADGWNASGRQVTLYLETPQAYAVSVPFALACAERALQDDAPSGALTPSQLIGTDAMLAVPGVQLYEA
jgi:short subunit dehydrogenase-like uncharacterized protein